MSANNTILITCETLVLAMFLHFQGSMEIRKIRLKKEKHTWSVQVMNELLREGKLYKFESSEISGSPKLRSELSDSVAIKQFEGSEKG